MVRGKTKDMTVGSPMRHIIEFSVPLLLGFLFQQLYNVFDAMIVGRFVGLDALAAVGSTGSVNFLIIGFCMGVCNGFSIPLAQRFGARDNDGMKKYMMNAIYLSVFFAVILTVVTVVFCKQILVAMDTPGDILALSYNYIVIILAGIPVTFLYNLISGIIRAMGDSKTPVYFLVMSSVINIVLDLVLINVFSMGVVGAAVATVVSQLVSGVCCVIYSYKRYELLHVEKRFRKIDGRSMGKLLYVGIPMGLQYSITAIGSVILQKSVNSLGKVAVASMTAGGTIAQETRRWDDVKGMSIVMRSKEDAQDYRYFPEPDLPPIELSDEYIDTIRQQLPELPEAKKARYKSEYGLTDYDTDMICSSVSYVRLFERTVEITGNPKDSAHWIMGEVMKLLNDSQTLPEDMHFNPDALGRIIQLQNGNKISRDSAKKVLAAVFTDNVDPDEYVKQNQMEMVSDTGAIRKVVQDVLAQNEKAVNEYKGGKAASFNFLIGQCMRALRGKAPAAEVTKILKEILG